MTTIREVLVLHHSHTDIGYTHPQPVLWELQRRFIDQALDLCEATADWAEPSRVRWTCETTMPVAHWLEHASSRQVERFRQLASAGQISVAAMPCNITPLWDAAQLSQGLDLAKRLRDELGLPLTVAINHDVNGLPWPITQLLLDAGIEMLIMGINVHFGGYPLTRPLAFRWRGSDGRELLAWNGEHYQGFDRVFRLREGTLDAMAAGFAQYAQSLKDYRHDFVFLTATNPWFPDNNPPRAATAELIRQWNAEGRAPLIRYVTPELFLQRVRSLPVEIHAGDWPDFWSFGCASAANEVRINRETKRRLAAADLLGARSDKAWWFCNLADEHTYTSWHSVDEPHRDHAAEQWHHKASYVYTARSLTGLLLRDALEKIAGNPREAAGVQGVLLFNPSPLSRREFLRVPKPWLRGEWQHHVSTVQQLECHRERWADTDSELIGPVELPACGYRIVPIDELKPAAPPQGLAAGDGFIESPFHRLRFEAGKITELVDKTTGAQWLDAGSPWSFFGLVQETASSRDALVDMNWELINIGVRTWKTDWQATRTAAPRPDSYRVETAPDGVSLILEWADAPGVLELRQRVKLLAHRPAIELTATFRKKDILTPEGLYFAFPLDVAGWRAHYDTANLPVEYDAEQLPNANRDYVMVGSWVSVHNPQRGVTLACPDAPLVQIGDFSFGRMRKSVPRDRKPLLLAWPMNNYWNTNFRASQPGFARFRYELVTHGPFDPVVSTRAALATVGIELHPVVKLPRRRQRRLLDVQGEIPLRVTKDSVLMANVLTRSLHRVPRRA